MGKVMHNFKRFLTSRRGQILFNVLYSWGAAVVILGALFKIMHYPYGDYILTIGMIVEVIVFIAAGLDYSSAVDTDSEPIGNNMVVGNGFLGGSAVGSSNIQEDINVSNRGKAIGSSGSVVVIGGSGVQQSGTSLSSTPMSQPIENISGKATAPEYAQSLTNTAQNLEEFSQTIQSLNEASQKILNAYKQVDDTHGFAENLATLNQNVSGLNEVFNGQLQTITEQMAAIRYINDSLQRMKNLYDGAIGDSYMFKEESAKMTKHIEALNNVYARLLQAMTTNSNNNMNQTNF